VTVGAVHDTFKEFAVPVAVTAVAAAGTEVALTKNGADDADTNEVVALPLGRTVNVYVSPFVRPEIVQLCAPLGGVTLLITVHVPFTAFAWVVADETV
jgi:hypothetical protein